MVDGFKSTREYMGYSTMFLELLFLVSMGQLSLDTKKYISKYFYLFSINKAMKRLIFFFFLMLFISGIPDGIVKRNYL